MFLETIVVGSLAVNCYIVGDKNSREVIIIDPGDDAPKILEVVRRAMLNVKAIVNTHAHFDHVGAVEQVRICTSAQHVGLVN